MALVAGDLAPVRRADARGGLFLNCLRRARSSEVARWHEIRPSIFAGGRQCGAASWRCRRSSDRVRAGHDGSAEAVATRPRNETAGIVVGPNAAWMSPGSRLCARGEVDDRSVARGVCPRGPMCRSTFGRSWMASPRWCARAWAAIPIGPVSAGGGCSDHHLLTLARRFKAHARPVAVREFYSGGL